MRVMVEHTVFFWLDQDEGEILPVSDTATGRMYGRLDAVTVHLYSDRPPQVSAWAKRCRRDGSPDDRLGGGNVLVTVQLPDPGVWIDKALEAVVSSTYS